MTRSATFDLISLNSRSRRLREVTYLPSLPANGPLLAMNCILTVGSSISSSGSTIGRGDLGDGLADGEILHAGDRADVAGGGLGQLEALERLVAEHLRDAELLALAVAVDAAARDRRP